MVPAEHPQSQLFHTQNNSSDPSLSNETPITQPLISVNSSINDLGPNQNLTSRTNEATEKSNLSERHESVTHIENTEPKSSLVGVLESNTKADLTMSHTTAQIQIQSQSASLDPAVSVHSVAAENKIPKEAQQVFGQPDNAQPPAMQKQPLIDANSQPISRNSSLPLPSPAEPLSGISNRSNNSFSFPQHLSPQPHAFPSMTADFSSENKIDPKNIVAQNPGLSMKSLMLGNPPKGVTPKITTTLWEDEGTLCFQVEVKGICVARREDNNMINGTKLLNIAEISRGRRDGLLKAERVRHVMKVGAMHFKGVWIPYDRAVTFAHKENIIDLLYPLFIAEIKELLYHSTNYTRTALIMSAALRKREENKEKLRQKREILGKQQHDREQQQKHQQAIQFRPQVQFSNFPNAAPNYYPPITSTGIPVDSCRQPSTAFPQHAPANIFQNYPVLVNSVSPMSPPVSYYYPGMQALPHPGSAPPPPPPRHVISDKPQAEYIIPPPQTHHFPQMGETPAVPTSEFHQPVMSYPNQAPNQEHLGNHSDQGNQENQISKLVANVFQAAPPPPPEYHMQYIPGAPPIPNSQPFVPPVNNVTMHQ